MGKISHPSNGLTTCFVLCKTQDLKESWVFGGHCKGHWLWAHQVLLCLSFKSRNACMMFLVSTYTLNIPYAYIEDPLVSV